MPGIPYVLGTPVHVSLLLISQCYLRTDVLVKSTIYIASTQTCTHLACRLFQRQKSVSHLMNRIGNIVLKAIELYEVPDT